MTNGKRKKRARSASVASVDPDELAFAVALGQAAWRHRMPMESPSRYGFNLAADSGITRYTFRDVPLNRFALAIREHCGPDEAKFYAIMFRVFAFMRVQRSEHMRNWTKRCDADPEAILIHPAVIAAAATAPLSEQQPTFAPKAFFSRVENLAAHEFQAAD
jgi:hypothetical protein